MASESEIQDMHDRLRRLESRAAAGPKKTTTLAPPVTVSPPEPAAVARQAPQIAGVATVDSGTVTLPQLADQLNLLIEAIRSAGLMGE